MGDDASDSGAGNEKIPASPSDDGLFIQYNIFGNIFEVTCKYKPPVLPIGKGAYGIVWYPSFLFALIIIVIIFFLYIFEFALF